MASKNCPVSVNGGGSEGDLAPIPKTKVSRVRTGCFTCRKRRKKCDETRPACRACLKTNIVCEGYPPCTIWEARTSRRRTTRSKLAPTIDGEIMGRTGKTTTEERISNSSIVPIQNPRTYDEEILTCNGEMTHWFNGLISPQSSPIHYDQSPVSIGGSPADLDYNVLFQQFSQPLALEGSFGSSTQLQAMLKPRQCNIRSIISGGNEVFQPINTVDSYWLPPQLPSLISGVESTLHRRLFYHFTHIMSRVLTISGDDSNPMNAIVIPLAMGNKTLMHTILSLACSHLLKLQRAENNLKLSAERYQLHEKALNAQKQRIQVLKASARAMGTQDRDAIFATSLLLCLYEICEGTGDDGWRTHLDEAREVLGVASAAATINPFLLEFFLYHDSLAMVTVPSPAPRFNCTTNLSDQNPSLVGVQDGLIEYVIRISSLRLEAGPGPSPPDYQILNKALAIEEDLSRWEPKVTLCKERRLIAEFYQWALFIWLFSIIYPDGKSDPKVQSVVQRLAAGMSEIKSGDGVMACLLFPLFIVGSAAIRQEDRSAVAKHFKRVRAWSSLGNVDLTYKVVGKMWQEHDAGMPRSWDWVMQLERHGMSLLVT